MVTSDKLLTAPFEACLNTKKKMKIIPTDDNSWNYFVLVEINA